MGWGDKSYMFCLLVMRGGAVGPAGAMPLAEGSRLLRSDRGRDGSDRGAFACFCRTCFCDVTGINENEKDCDRSRRGGD